MDKKIKVTCDCGKDVIIEITKTKSGKMKFKKVKSDKHEENKKSSKEDKNFLKDFVFGNSISVVDSEDLSDDSDDGDEDEEEE